MGLFGRVACICVWCVHLDVCLWCVYFNVCAMCVFGCFYLGVCMFVCIYVFVTCTMRAHLIKNRDEKNPISFWKFQERDLKNLKIKQWISKNKIKSYLRHMEESEHLCWCVWNDVTIVDISVVTRSFISLKYKKELKWK